MRPQPPAAPDLMQAINRFLDDSLRPGPAPKPGPAPAPAPTPSRDQLVQPPSQRGSCPAVNLNEPFIAGGSTELCITPEFEQSVRNEVLPLLQSALHDPTMQLVRVNSAVNGPPYIVTSRSLELDVITRNGPRHLSVGIEEGYTQNHATNGPPAADFVPQRYVSLRSIDYQPVR